MIHIVFTVHRQSFGGIVGLSQRSDRCESAPSGRLSVWPGIEEGMRPMASLDQRHGDVPVLRLAVGP